VVDTEDLRHRRDGLELEDLCRQLRGRATSIVSRSITVMLKQWVFPWMLVSALYPLVASKKFASLKKVPAAVPVFQLSSCSTTHT
jgi:hypothetical protein